jgi:hypothetical protein
VTTTKNAYRIDQILEELRLNTEDLHELAKQAVDRAGRTTQSLQKHGREGVRTEPRVH